MPSLADLLFVPSRAPGDGAARRAATRAALALAGLGFCLSTICAFTLPVLLAPDERAHLGYVEVLLEGDLPTVDRDIPVDGRFIVLRQYYPDGSASAGRYGDVWVANHPPLAYLVATPVAWAASAVGFDRGAPMAMRLLSGLGMLVGVLATVAVSDALLPAERRTAAVAAGLVALTPALVSIGGYGYTDGFAFAVGTSLLAVLLRVARWGPTRPRFVALVALGSAALLSRSSLLPLVPLAAVVWLSRTWGQGPARALVRSAIVVVVPVLAGGWFYLRNVDLYGSATGSGYLQEKFRRSDSGTTLRLLARPRFLLGAWQDLWGSFSDFGDRVSVGSGRTIVGSPASRIGSRLLIGGGLAALAVLGWVGSWWRERARRPRRAAWLSWGAATGWTVVGVVGMASFVSGGGTPHARYLLPALSVIATVLAGGFARLPRGPAVSGGVLIVLMGLDLVLVVRMTTFVQVGGFSPPLQQPGSSALIVLLAYVAAIAAGLVAAFALVATNDQRLTGATEIDASGPSADHHS